jgi:hypothetical protein
MKKILIFLSIFFLSFAGLANASNDSWCYNFQKDLQFGDKGADVEALKTALIKEGFYQEGWTSDSFDVYITAALMGFQDKYKSEILTPAGLTKPTGIVSKNTRKKLNTLFVCKKNSIDSVSSNPDEKESIVNSAFSYIKNYLAPGMEIAVNKIDDLIKSFYRFEVMTSSGIVPTYVSIDGKLLVLQEVDLTKIPANSQNTAAVEMKKSDKPQVELFVMSHCPYGTQIEKGIIPVVEALGDKIDFQLKFCSYSMHDEKELKEELNQYCIQKEQKDKLLTYLKCFLKDENSSASCMISAKIDDAKLQSCISTTEKEYKVLDNFKNKTGWTGQFPGFDVFKADNEKYGVQGSPALVINGSQVLSNRDSNSLLSSICSAFNNAPEACRSNLSSETPAPGFGEGSVQSGSTAGCGQ